MYTINLVKLPMKNWGLETYSPELGQELVRIVNMNNYYPSPFQLLPLFRSFREASAFVQSHNITPPHIYTAIEFLTSDWSKIQEAALQFAIHASVELHQQSQEDYYRGIHNDKSPNATTSE